jgi:3-hydroxyisobutyrate dehydrogenase
VPLEISPLLIEIMSDGQRRYGERAQSDRIIERLEEATGLSIRAEGFPTVLVDDEPEEEGYEIVEARPWTLIGSTSGGMGRAQR